MKNKFHNDLIKTCELVYNLCKESNYLLSNINSETFNEELDSILNQLSTIVNDLFKMVNKNVNFFCTFYIYNE